MAVLGGDAVSYERGTPAAGSCSSLVPFPHLDGWSKSGNSGPMFGQANLKNSKSTEGDGLSDAALSATLKLSDVVPVFIATAELCFPLHLHTRPPPSPHTGVPHLQENAPP